ncbi:photosynthetic NDH subunit of subcomplex B 4, chloroplastic [Olea europaea var. sylvestris]|uniref:photosynthetic NDH subunit of subcomplex B 4, chloroplastic n=1 Tax=Olea europaea var. sylvestris TaxID=158386 RepID=UPI000C1D6B90|nr:photosynthetic NDH subunit of subcomplex B 4, chloroplastic [Olea europaea var. sylvestris]
MADTIMSFSFINPHIQTTKLDFNSFPRKLRQCSNSTFGCGNRHQKIYKRSSTVKVNALPDWPLMAVLVEHMEGQRDLITHKSIWHLSDEAMKNVCEYLFLISKHFLDFISFQFRYGTDKAPDGHD